MEISSQKFNDYYKKYIDTYQRIADALPSAMEKIIPADIQDKYNKKINEVTDKLSVFKAPDENISYRNVLKLEKEFVKTAVSFYDTLRNLERDTFNIISDDRLNSRLFNSADIASKHQNIKQLVRDFENKPILSNYSESELKIPQKHDTFSDKDLDKISKSLYEVSANLKPFDTSFYREFGNAEKGSFLRQLTKVVDNNLSIVSEIQNERSSIEKKINDPKAAEPVDLNTLYLKEKYLQFSIKRIEKGVGKLSAFVEGNPHILTRPNSLSKGLNDNLQACVKESNRCVAATFANKLSLY